MFLLFMDCETTGLDPVVHVPWEVAAVSAEHTDDGQLVVLDETETLVRLTASEMATADPVALEIGMFSERYYDYEARQDAPLAQPGKAARAIDNLCNYKPHLVGAVPSFDDRRVGDMMRRCGITPRWHYHLIDIEPLVVGYLKGFLSGQSLMTLSAAAKENMWKARKLPPTWKSDDLSRAIGVNPDGFDRHTAMGDVRWCMAQYAAVFGLQIAD